MVKKRKQTPQSSTLLDFFGKGLTSSTARTAKKARLADPTYPKQDSAKSYVAKSKDIIVIDSDDDEVICVSPRPGPKPVQTRKDGHSGLPPTSKTCAPHIADHVSGELSAHTCHSDIPSGTDVLIGGLVSIKSEQQEVLPSSLPAGIPAHGSRDISPFGFPELLVPRDVDNATGPPPTTLKDCSHDRNSSLQADIPPPVDSAILEGAEWDMGDDELEFIDVETRVKPEVSEEVDIDLTIDDEDSRGDDGDLVESCPICTQRFVGMTAQVRLSYLSLPHRPHIGYQQIHEHVDLCISAPPKLSAPCGTSTPSSSKIMRPLSSLPTPQPSQGPGDASVKPEVESIGADNVFSTLMTSYKENEAWKEASSVEDRNFRPTKANGGRRKAPFYKVLQGMPIAVDAFRYGAIPNVTAYFLT